MSSLVVGMVIMLHVNAAGGLIINEVGDHDVHIVDPGGGGGVLVVDEAGGCGCVINAKVGGGGGHIVVNIGSGDGLVINEAGGGSHIVNAGGDGRVIDNVLITNNPSENALQPLNHGRLSHQKLPHMTLDMIQHPRQG